MNIGLQRALAGSITGVVSETARRAIQRDDASCSWYTMRRLALLHPQVGTALNLNRLLPTVIRNTTSQTVCDNTGEFYSEISTRLKITHADHPDLEACLRHLGTDTLRPHPADAINWVNMRYSPGHLWTLFGKMYGLGELSTHHLKQAVWLAAALGTYTVLPKDYTAMYGLTNREVSSVFSIGRGTREKLAALDKWSQVSPRVSAHGDLPILTHWLMLLQLHS